MAVVQWGDSFGIALVWGVSELVSDLVRGNQLLRSGKLEEAVDAYQKAIAHHPDFHWSHFKLGEAYEQSENWTNAVAAYQKAIALHPDFHWFHYKLAEAYEQLGDDEEAIIAYRQAIKLNSKCSWFNYQLGMRLVQSGQVELAITVFNTGLKLKPADYKYYQELRNILVQKGVREKAITNYQKGIDINHNSVQLQSSLAFAIEPRLTRHDGINLDVNLALNKPTAQSSVYQPEVYGYDYQGACNGKKTGKFGFHTCQENQPWWQIDLQSIYQLTQIKIYNRISFEKRASALNILLSQDALNWELCYSNDSENIFGGIEGKPLIVYLQGQVTRFVRLQLREIGTLHLDEVEIYGIPVELDSSHLNYNPDENTLYTSFYGEDNFPSPIPIIQGIVARRNDGLGTRLMSILSARYACEYLGCNLYASWPRIVSRYYSSNILNINSCSEIFEGGKVFQDIDVPWINEEGLSKLNTKSLSNLNTGFKRKGCFFVLNKKQIETISQCQFLVWDQPWAIVPYGDTLQRVSLKVKDYWKKINWHHQIIAQIQKFKNQINFRPYLVVHIRRGDIIQRLLYDNIPTLNKDMPTIFRRFLPIKTAVSFVCESGFKDVVVCSECNKATLRLVDQVKQKNHQINCYITSEFTQSLSETQAAAYDLIIMSDGAKILTSLGSTFSTCAEFVSNTYRCKPIADWENTDWNNMADELIEYIDENDNEMTDERKSLVYLFISKYAQR
ncbi:tetratricopeptide repeat protein [Limnospira fusiformis]|uniref:tetratricopeptide repeat protein n=1 Tax=Limnospira fusiformis TaxID=54297 RepID=UPI00144978A0|nr:tetratricopeptide repeat protein [Limnospira fusiformis SAG 85.79]